jgi:hypothetical protein
MNRRRWSRLHTTVVAVATILTCAGCATGPLNSPSETSYHTGFSFSFDNGDSATTQNTALGVTGDLAVTVEGTSLRIRGTFVYIGYPAGAGTLAGAIDTSGNVTITQFGDPGSALGATRAFLHNTWPNCDFTQAVPLPYSGSAGSGLVNLKGGLTVPCTYRVNQRDTTLQTTMTENVSGNQQAPPPG